MQYPGFVDHSGTPADKENFTLLLASLKYALETLTATTGKVYGLTAALPCNPANINNIEVDKITTILTEVRLVIVFFVMLAMFHHRACLLMLHRHFLLHITSEVQSHEL